MSNEEVQKPVPKMEVIEYRLSVIEGRLSNTLEQLERKMDLLLEKFAESKSDHALSKQELGQTKNELNKMEIKLNTIGENVTKMQISLAEKLGYGVAGGGAITVIIELAQQLWRATHAV